jgi:hypothetical protein
MYEPDLKIHELLAKAKVSNSTPPKVKVRTLLGYFNVKSRKPLVVNSIRQFLKENGLRTEPDFETTPNMDIRVSICVIPPPAPSPKAPTEQRETIRFPVGMLKAANRKKEDLVLIDSRSKPGAKDDGEKRLEECLNLMLSKQAGHLIIGSEYSPRGIITWESYMKKRLPSPEASLSPEDVMIKNPKVMDYYDSILDAVDYVAQQGFVVIKKGNSITGVVTSKDIASEFTPRSKPFYWICFIEHGLRKILEGATPELTHEDYLAAILNDKDTRKNRERLGANDLTLGETIKMLSDHKTKFPYTSSGTLASLISQLEDVNKLRNDIFHFRIDPVDQDELSTLEKCMNYVNDITFKIP